MRDGLQRPLRDLRVSVTDRCNMRCTYCMPCEVFGRDFVFLRRAELLSFEEITRVARQCVAMGVRKIRLSGGEPLLRHHVERLVEMLAGLLDVEGKPIELTMTSNGVLLAKRARALKEAGLTRLNISLDALDNAVFQRMNGGRAAVASVLEGIDAAQAAGLTPLKVNAVIRRGVNEREILPLVEHFRHTGIMLRFIEYMDVGVTNGWRLDEVVTAQETLAQIDAEYPLQPIAPRYPGEVAKRWKFVDGGGEIGVIASVTQAFCHECSRLRLSVDGKLFTCLFAAQGDDLRGLLRSGEDEAANDEALRQRVTATWKRRTDRYSQLRLVRTEMPCEKIEMSYIGG
ncbi:cyclic pyranopterin monophosphate synthase [Betaproteobacteria bacterium]|nr:cyclic pyranopterin monophosphate synthase [Betaproteobacteria bacterium]GHT97943.1 cyclic pyranopterin monophosphate synthase [Betaproteobacteria bacterium]GHU29258.1 cyclic pyranopterin monophosphate synthase [Betaproteobacteria bacterium]